MPGVLSPAWWRTAVVYEIYPRSFADGNADGEGDLRGLTRRLPYLAELGVDAVWIAPWYPSPLADGGYDVSDYRSIHPRLGTLEDAEAMVDAAHRIGIRVIIDLVANHTSSEHPWFRQALAGTPGSPERQRYHFRDGRGAAGQLPPNNWISAFGGPAWTRVSQADGRPGQWYLHTFAPQQPDLDWQSAEVREEFDAILRFWLDRGIDGFRIDAAPAMAKKPGLPDADYGSAMRFASADWVDNPHWDVDEVHDILRRWRRVLDDYPGDRVFVGEALVSSPGRLARYLRPDELHTAFNFEFLHARWDHDELRAVIAATLAALEPVRAPATWVLSNHDEIRHLTRLGRTRSTEGRPGAATTVDLQVGARRARAALLLSLALPGSSYLYQGEELGLPEVEDLPDEARQDPVFSESGGLVLGRDGCRVPLPWSGSEPPFGFSPVGTHPWLPQPPSWHELTVQAQSGRAGSMLEFYRQALTLRRTVLQVAADDLTWLPAQERVLAFERGGRFRCVVNLSSHAVALDEEPTLASAPLAGPALLPPDAAAWFLSGPDRQT